MSMTKNPQVRFEGYSNKQYLFPKHSGKFFIQTQKLRDLKLLKNYMPHKVQRQVKFSTDLYKDEYKEMKAETDYIKKIQELKKKLQKQIKRYNNQKKTNEDLTKSLSLSIDHKSSLMKLEQICVKVRSDKEREQIWNPQYKQSKSLERKRYPKNFLPISYKLKNKTEMKRRSKTEESQAIEAKQFSYLSELREYYTNKTERLDYSSVIKLPSIQRQQNSLEGRYHLHDQSYNGHSLLSDIDKLTLSVNMTPKHLTKKQTELINGSNIQNESLPLKNFKFEKRDEHNDRRRFIFNHSDKYLAKRSKKILTQIDQKPKDNEIHLKGWEIGPQSKGFNDSDSIY